MDQNVLDFLSKSEYVNSPTRTLRSNSRAVGLDGFTFMQCLSHVMSAANLRCLQLYLLANPRPDLPGLYRPPLQHVGSDCHKQSASPAAGGLHVRRHVGHLTCRRSRNMIRHRLGKGSYLSCGTVEVNDTTAF